MKTAVHIALILLIGVGLGLGIVAMKSRTNSKKELGPKPGEVVYTNAPEIAPGDSVENVKPAENTEPAKPPSDAEWLSSFELTERNGKQVTSEQLLGSPYVVSFFFSTCPSICVRQNQKVKELQDMFEGQDVRFVAISVDPENDTPEKLREYAARFGADKEQWMFLTGDLKYIRRVGTEVFFQPVNKQFHTEKLILVDPKGKIEGNYSWPEPKQFEALQEKIREMLEAKS